MIFHANNSCNPIIAAKNANALAPYHAAIDGNVQLIKAAMNQWVALPNAWPLARTALGKISYEDPDDCTLAHRMRGLEDEQANRGRRAPDAVEVAAVVMKRPGDRQEAGEVAKRHEAYSAGHQ